MRSTITTIIFPYFFTDNERYDSLDYFGIEIIEEMRFFFFDVEDPARNQKFYAEMM